MATINKIKVGNTTYDLSSTSSSISSYADSILESGAHDLNAFDYTKFLMSHNFNVGAAPWSNGPTGLAYGHVIQFPCYSGDLVTQMAVDSPLTTGDKATTNNFYVRIGNPAYYKNANRADKTITDQNGSWNLSKWKRVAWADELNEYIPLGGSSAITGALIPAAKQDIELGSVSCPWNEVYFNTTYTNYIAPIYASDTIEIQSKILNFAGDSGDSCGAILSIGDGNDRGLIFEGIIADGVTAEHGDNDDEIVLCSSIFNFVGNLEEDMTYEGSSGFSDTQLMVYGKITVSSRGSVTAPAFYQTSDIRKKDIKEEISLDKCYDLIDKCQTIIYSLKDQTKEQIGMIAQEVEEFFPEVIQTDEEGFKSLDYSRLVVICFKVLKDLIKRVSKLEEK